MLSATALLGSACSSGLQYPETAREDVKDSYFGVEVADPYRWLENDTTKRVAQWVEAENALTNAYLAKIPFRGQLQQRISELFNFDVESVPSYSGRYYTYFRKEGLSNQSVLYVKDSLNGEERVLLDPNKLSTDGTVMIRSIWRMPLQMQALIGIQSMC